MLVSLELVAFVFIEYKNSFIYIFIYKKYIYIFYVALSTLCSDRDAYFKTSSSQQLINIYIDIYAYT